MSLTIGRFLRCLNCSSRLCALRCMSRRLLVFPATFLPELQEKVPSASAIAFRSLPSRFDVIPLVSQRFPELPRQIAPSLKNQRGFVAALRE